LPEVSDNYWSLINFEKFFLIILFNQGKNSNILKRSPMKQEKQILGNIAKDLFFINFLG